MTQSHTSLSCCEDCEPEAPTRNHYFTGKLLVERDFTDEQRYFREKIRLHHQRLHGSGIVCGLELVAAEACADRKAVLRAGSAIDCCGHDIYVLHDEEIVFADFPALAEIAAQAADSVDEMPAHRLQFCLRYAECPNEDIPVLFDECGCDETQCAPNRILEAFAIDVLVDPPERPSALYQPSLAWTDSLAIAHARAATAGSGRIYVLAGTTDTTVYVLAEANHAVIEAVDLAGKPLALALAPDGATLAVVTADAGKSVLSVFDAPASGLGAAPDRSEAIPGFGGDPVAMAYSAQVVAVADLASGEVAAFAPDLPAPLAPLASASLGGGLAGLALFGESAGATALKGTDKLRLLDFTGAAIGVTDLPVAGMVADHIARVPDPAGDRLAVLDASVKTLSLVDAEGGTVLGTSAAMPMAPVALAIDAAGKWAWIASEEAGGPGKIQVLDLAPLRTGDPSQPGNPLPIGEGMGSPVFIGAELLAVPYAGDEAVEWDGAVALLTLSEADCWGILDGKDCPDCIDTPDCITLAIIEGWRPGYKVLGGPSAEDDGANGIARISLEGRPILPSTHAIVQALRCLRITGGKGEKGDKGDPGTNGTNGMNGTNGINGANGINGTNGQDGAEGPPGKSAVDEDLTHICSISWEHRGELDFAEFDQRGLVIAFDRGVENDPANWRMIVRVQARSRDEQGFECWCDLPAKTVRGIKLSNRCDAAGDFENSNDSLADGVHWLPANAQLLRELREIRVLLSCDLLPDEKKKSVDGNHLSPFLPNVPSGDMIAGGMFESWFTIKRG